MTEKKRLYHEFARVGKALSSPARLEILDLLAQGEKTVEAIAAGAGLEVKNASAHLRALRAARLVQARKAPPWVYYGLADDDVVALVRSLEALARARLAEVEQIARRYLNDRDSLEPVSADELQRLIDDGSATVLDVRPQDEFDSGHIAGAVSLPVAELERRLSELPRDHEIVAYCRGPYCVYAVDAVTILRRHGFRARRLEEGLPDWRLSGRTVESALDNRE